MVDTPHRHTHRQTDYTPLLSHSPWRINPPRTKRGKERMRKSKWKRKGERIRGKERKTKEGKGGAKKEAGNERRIKEGERRRQKKR